MSKLHLSWILLNIVIGVDIQKHNSVQFIQSPLSRSARSLSSPALSSSTPDTDANINIYYLNTTSTDRLREYEKQMAEDSKSDVCIISQLSEKIDSSAKIIRYHDHCDVLFDKLQQFIPFIQAKVTHELTKQYDDLNSVLTQIIYAFTKVDHVIFSTILLNVHHTYRTTLTKFICNKIQRLYNRMKRENKLIQQTELFDFPIVGSTMEANRVFDFWWCAMDSIMTIQLQKLPPLDKNCGRRKIIFDALLSFRSRYINKPNFNTTNFNTLQSICQNILSFTQLKVIQDYVKNSYATSIDIILLYNPKTFDFLHKSPLIYLIKHKAFHHIINVVPEIIIDIHNAQNLSQSNFKKYEQHVIANSNSDNDLVIIPESYQNAYDQAFQLLGKFASKIKFIGNKEDFVQYANGFIQELVCSFTKLKNDTVFNKVMKSIELFHEKNPKKEYVQLLYNHIVTIYELGGQIHSRYTFRIGNKNIQDALVRFWWFSLLTIWKFERSEILLMGNQEKDENLMKMIAALDVCIGKIKVAVDVMNSLQDLEQLIDKVVFYKTARGILQYVHQKRDIQKVIKVSIIVQDEKLLCNLVTEFNNYLVGKKTINSFISSF